MKKFLAILMAILMVLSMATVAMASEMPDPSADPVPENPSPTYDDMKTVTVYKEYNAVGDTAVSPAETFSFSAVSFESASQTGSGYTEEWANSNVPTINSVSYAAGDAGKDDTTKKKAVTITLPTNYPSVGIYNYSFTETDNGTAGVTYRSTPIKLVVTVIEQDGKKRVAAVHCEGENGTKSAVFENTYSAGSLKVTKEVTGLMGDKNKEFQFSVTITAPTGKNLESSFSFNKNGSTASDSSYNFASNTVTFTLKDGESFSIGNLPVGVTCVVSEAAEEGYETKINGQTATKTDDNKYKKEVTISTATESTVDYTNDKGGAPDTGVSLDTLPYVLVLALAGAGLVLMIARKRRVQD